MKLSLRDLAKTSVIEEAAEVIKVLMKIDRFGLYSDNPHAPEEGSNLQQLSAEIGDLLGAIDFLREQYPEMDEALILKNQRTRREKLIQRNQGERLDTPFVFKEGSIYAINGFNLGKIEPSHDSLTIDNLENRKVKLTVNDEGRITGFTISSEQITPDKG